MSKKNDSQQNFENYRKGKAKLENAVLQHPEESKGGKSVYDFMKGEVRRNMWVIPYEQFKKRDK